MNLDINNVEEIVVKYADGQEVIFRSKGLEKLRKLMKLSPPLHTEQSKKVIVDEESSSEEKPKKRSKTPRSANGYNVVNLEYGAGSKKELSPHDLAKDMQRQAEKTSGVKY